MSYRNVKTNIKKSVWKQCIDLPSLESLITKNLCRIDVESVGFIPFPWNKYSLGIQNLFINPPWKCRIDKLAARKNNHLINYLRRFAINVPGKFSRKLPQKSSILCNIKEIICQRIHGKALFEESIFVEAAIDMQKNAWVLCIPT